MGTAFDAACVTLRRLSRYGKGMTRIQIFRVAFDITFVLSWWLSVTGALSRLPVTLRSTVSVLRPYLAKCPYLIKFKQVAKKWLVAGLL